MLAGGFADPLLLLAAPVALVLLWLLERLRRRPVELVVADLTLFAPTPEVEAAARSRRRQLGLRLLLLALAALLLSVAAAGPSVEPAADGPLVVDLVLDAGITSGARDGAGTRLDQHRLALEAVLDRLRPDDRVRVHVVPGPANGGSALPPTDARAVLRAAVPTAAPADLEGVLARLGPRRVVVATDRLLPLAAATILVVAGSPAPDRGLVALEADGETLRATVASWGAPGEAEVELAARGPDGVERTTTRRVTCPAHGAARVAWSAADGLPEGAIEARARLLGGDALPADDLAFAALATPRRRVGLSGVIGPATRRALAAVPGTSLVELAPGAVAGLAPGALDLLVVDALPDLLPDVALAVVPAALPRVGTVTGGTVTGRALAPGGSAEAFRWTLAEAARAPVVVDALGPPPRGLADATPLLVAGQAPLALARGSGRRLVLVLTCPPERAPGLTASELFPLLWGEALALAAPGGDGRLAAHPCGTPLPDGPAPNHVLRRTDPDGRAILGTVAAPAVGVDAPSPPRPLAPADLEGLEAARTAAPPRPRPAAPALAGLVFAALAWLAGRPRARDSGPRRSETPREG